MSPLDDDVLISAAAAAILHDVTRSTIRSWVRRGLLTVSRQDNAGANWFLIQDVDRAEMIARNRDTTGRTQRRAS